MQKTPWPRWLMMVSMARAGVRALRAPDGDHRVDRLDTGLQRLLHALALHDAGRLHLDLARLLGGDGALPVDRMAQRVHHAADHRRAHRDLGDAAGALDDVPLPALLAPAHQR